MNSNLPANINIEEINQSASINNVELLPHIRKLPNVLYGIFVELLRQFYSDDNEKLFGVPTKIWKPNPAETDIWIDTELRWEDEHPEKRPAIYVHLTPITYQSLTNRKDGLVGYDSKSSEYHFSRSGTGRVSFNHVSSSAGEACMLADSTLDYFDAFSMAIRNDFCFTSFYLVERIPLKLGEKDSKEKYESVVTFEYEFQDKWILKLESVKLKRIILNAGQNIFKNVIV